MMLWRGEMKKTLMTQRGIWILLVCLVLKLAFLCAFPEQKDRRIVLSQKQYDKYLDQLYGENTRKKSDWILAEYETCKEVRDNQEAMQGKYARGEITDARWEAYTQALTQADLHINSAQIFAEKAEQFLKQPEDIPPAHYIYEYGWQTVFALLQVPDVFLLFGLLVLTAQCFPAEVSSGMLPVLLAARNGRRKLFRAKLLALLTVGLVAAVMSGGLEWVVFSLRGWCHDAAAPLYSITRLAACPLELSLGAGYVLCLGVRLLATLLLVTVLFGLSVWLKSTTNLIFSGLCILALPLLWGGTAALFTHGGLLSGTRMLLWLGESVRNLLLPVVTVTAYSIAVAFFAARRHARGPRVFGLPKG